MMTKVLFWRTNSVKHVVTILLLLFSSSLQCVMIAPPLRRQTRLTFDEFKTLLAMLANINIRISGVLDVHMYDWPLLAPLTKGSVYLGDYIADSSVCGINKKMIFNYPQESEIIESIFSMGKFDKLATDYFFVLFCSRAPNFFGDLSQGPIKYVDINDMNYVLKKKCTLLEMANEYDEVLSLLARIYKANSRDFLNKITKLNAIKIGAGVCRTTVCEQICEILGVKPEDISNLPEGRRVVNDWLEIPVAAVSCLLRVLPTFISNLIWIIANTPDLKRYFISLFTVQEVEFIKSGIEIKHNMVNYLYALNPPTHGYFDWVSRQYNRLCFGL